MSTEAVKQKKERKPRTPSLESLMALHKKAVETAERTESEIKSRLANMGLSVGE